MRSKIPDLALALEGRFGDHHALMCRLHLDHIDHLEEMIAKLDTQIEVMMKPFRVERELLTTVPGIGLLAAAAVISEIGAGVTEFFPDAAHLASWTGLCPGNHESAGKRSSGKRRHGNPHIQAVLVEAAWSAVRHDGYLKSLYHRHVMKWGGYRSPTAKKKAIIVVAHALLVIIWHVLPPAGPTTSSAPTTSPAASTPTGKPAASSQNSKPSDTRSASSQPPDPAPPATPRTDDHRPGFAVARLAENHSRIRDGIDHRRGTRHYRRGRYPR
jgi:transposase